MSRGIIPKKRTVHISYIHHPPRYLYGYETAVEWQKYFIVRIYAYIVNHFLRIWDFESSKRPDYIIANSQETKKRIEKFYRRNSTVIYPPVSIPNKITDRNMKSDYYVTVSRLARAKHIDILIRAANKKKFKLKIIGSGRDEKYLKSIAGKTVEFLGNIRDEQFEKYLSGARAFLFSPRDEEFGIAAVEALGYGIPVIAYASGGIPEYIKDGINGYLFNELNPDSLIVKMEMFEKANQNQLKQMKKNARKSAEFFSEENFKKNLLDFVQKNA